MRAWTCLYERQGDRQRGRATDIMPAGVSCVKCSILVKTHLAVSTPLLAIKPYSLVLVTPLMVFHYSLPKDLFLYMHTDCSQFPPSYAILCHLKPSALSGTNVYTWKNRSILIKLFVILLLMFTLQMTAKALPLSGCGRRAQRSLWKERDQ